MPTRLQQYFSVKITGDIYLTALASNEILASGALTAQS